MKKIYVLTAATAIATGAIASSALIGELFSENRENASAETEQTETAANVRRKAEAVATDITAEYIKNPSFELDDISKLAIDNNRGAYQAPAVNGWTLSGKYGVSDIMTESATATDDNFGVPGKPSDGKQMYYIRNSWNTSTATLLQTVTLPAGTYKLAADNKCMAKSSHAASLVAGNEATSLSFGSSMPSTWTTTELTFELETETTLDLGLRVNFGPGAGGSIIIDNFRLYSVIQAEDPTEAEVPSHTEGIINNTFVPESEMKRDLLQMLADFSTYLVNDFQEASAPNNQGEACGCFKGEATMANNEQGVRPNADLSMICAFLVKYAKPAGIKLPTGVTYDKLADMARKSLVFAYSTHKANKLKVCAGNNYWGSTSTSDYVWESSLWAMSVAYSAYFQWDDLTDKQKGYIYNMLKAECNYELYRPIPTGYAGDTKAEENGWEADILAATLGLFPDDALADKWFERMREMAVNSYSHVSDGMNNTVIDPWYNNKTVADLYKGANLYDDYSLQNHNLFHTSYQNVVMQELGEAALALKMFQNGVNGTEKWKSNALMHNNQQVQDSILNWLALADGELAMPNGNDWSLFLYDQITSYSTQACFQRDANALMLENLAYKYIKARQKTTTDGSWLLRADVGARRMGVEAHRVMMTYLMHDEMPTADLTPTSWDDFNAKYSEARLIPCQNVVRASSDYRFTCFSWSNGLKSYTGYFASNSADKNKIVVPYRANNTGNITGWYDVSGKKTDASPVVSGIYQLDGNAYVMNGELSCNQAALDNRFAIYSTPANAVIYLDYVTANTGATITAAKGGLLAISTDELMKIQRTLYYSKADGSIAHKQTDGSSFFSAKSDWVNIDNELGVVGKNGTRIAFGDREANNSIYTSKLYPMYNNQSRSVTAGAVVDARNLVYYSLIGAEQTKAYAEALVPLRSSLPTGWNGVIAPDNGTAYMLISNFRGDTKAQLSNLTYAGKAPVLKVETAITSDGSSATLSIQQNNSLAQELKYFIKANSVKATVTKEERMIIEALSDETITISANGAKADASIDVKAGSKYMAYIDADGNIICESYTEPTEEKNLTGMIVNPSFDSNLKYGWTGDFATNFGCAERFSANTDVYQVITGLKPGKYILTCQGFYRNGGYNDANTKRINGTEKINAVLYANEYSTPLKSIFDDANKAGATGVKVSSGYIPDNMEQADIYFRKGLYMNTLECNVGEDGILRIGIKKTPTVTNDWAIFDNFTLTYAATVSEEKTFTTYGSMTYGYNASLSGTATVYELNGIYEGYVYGTPVTEIEAGKPYIVSEGTLTLTVKNGETATTEASSYNGFYGVLGSSYIATGSDYMVFYNGEVMFANESGTNVKPGKAYFVTSEVPDGKDITLNARRITRYQTEDLTGISAAEQTDATDATYNVAGQRVSRESKGIVINNGKKAINK